jgi:hypothetical protein
MNLGREILASHFSEDEIDAIKSGYSLPTGSLGLDKLILRRVAKSTLGKVCLVAVEQESLPHSYGEFGDSGRMNIYSLSNTYPLNDNWSIHVDVGVKDDGEIEEKPISDPNSISAIEVCLSPEIDIYGALDDFGYEGQIFTRTDYYHDWTASTTSPIEEQVELLHILGQKISL